MATVTKTPIHDSEAPDDQEDLRVSEFCSARYPDLFHAFAYTTDIWKQDPFDVESIHRPAREV